MTHRARRLHELLEPLCLVAFFSPEPRAEMVRLGARSYWDGYVAGRAAPLGRVPAEVVDAAFYSFGPGEIARHVPAVWGWTTPEQARAARERGCAAALRTILGDLAQAPATARAADLLARVALAAPVHGRVMYAALRSLPLPEDPVARLWHAADTLREHRGDGHVAALVAHEVPGTQAHLLLALDQGIDPPTSFGRVHHLPAAYLEEHLQQLRARGVLDDAGRHTEAGRALKRSIEDLTDVLADPPWAATAPEDLLELEELLAPISARVAAVGSRSDRA